MNILKKFKTLFDPIDLTQGNIWKKFIPFLIPIILSMIFQQIYSLTDSIIVGKTLSENEIAGVNDAIPMSYLVLNFTIGCTAGFSVVIAKAIGAKNDRLTRQSLMVQTVLAILVSIIMTVIAYFMVDLMLKWVKIYPSKTDPNMQEIYESARTYLVIMFVFGMIANMMYNLIVSVLRALGDSFVPFLILVVSTGLNIGMDLLFIKVFYWGVSGSAYATVMSQALAAIFAYIYIFVRYKQLRLHKEDFVWNPHFVWEHLKLGLPLGFQWSILYVGVVIMQAAVIPFDVLPSGQIVSGNPAQVGYGVANKLSGFLSTFFNAIGAGILSFVSQNAGAKEYDRIREGTKNAALLTIGVALAMMGLGFLLTINGAYQKIFLSSDKITEDTLKYGNAYLYVALPFYIPLGFIILGRNFMQAVEKPLFPLISGITELIARTLICLFLPELFNHGPINSEANMLSYCSVMSADSITWILSSLAVMIPTLVYLKKYCSKNSPKTILQ